MGESHKDNGGWTADLKEHISRDHIQISSKTDTTKLQKVKMVVIFLGRATERRQEEILGCW